jgi:hypothetical protein
MREKVVEARSSMDIVVGFYWKFLIVYVRVAFFLVVFPHWNPDCFHIPLADSLSWKALELVHNPGPDLMPLPLFE